MLSNNSSRERGTAGPADVREHFFDAHSLTLGYGISLEDGDWEETLAYKSPSGSASA